MQSNDIRRQLHGCWRSPFFGTRVITALRQLNGNRFNRRPSIRASCNSGPRRSQKVFIKFYRHSIQRLCLLVECVGQPEVPPTLFPCLVVDVRILIRWVGKKSGIPQSRYQCSWLGRAQRNNPWVKLWCLFGSTLFFLPSSLVRLSADLFFSQLPARRRTWRKYPSDTNFPFGDGSELPWPALHRVQQEELFSLLAKSWSFWY